MSIPYVSQLGNTTNNDCGAACLLMLLRARGLDGGITVEQLYREMQPSGDVYLSAGQIVQAGSRRGLTLEWRQLTQPSEGCIALIQRGPLVDAGQTEPGVTFRGAHFVVVTGTRENMVRVHDPLWTAHGGAHRWLPPDVWWLAWNDVPQGGHAPASRYALVPTLASGRRYRVVTSSGLRIRRGPGTQYAVAGGMSYGQIFSGIAERRGPDNAVWVQLDADRWAARVYGGAVLAVEL